MVMEEEDLTTRISDDDEHPHRRRRARARTVCGHGPTTHARSLPQANNFQSRESPEWLSPGAQGDRLGPEDRRTTRKDDEGKGTAQGHTRSPSSS